MSLEHCTLSIHNKRMSNVDKTDDHSKPRLQMVQTMGRRYRSNIESEQLNDDHVIELL